MGNNRLKRFILILEEEFFFCSALSMENTWFCYRKISSDSWLEVKIKIVGEVVFGKDLLTRKELNFLRTYVINNLDD